MTNTLFPSRARIFSTAAVFTMMLLAWPQPAFAQTRLTAIAVQKLDEGQFTGTWYEIARYPYKREKRCAGNVFEQIALDDKPHRFQLVDSCLDKAGYTDARNLTARAEDKKGDGELKVTTFSPFTRKYWVLALGPAENGSATWALVGSPNHKDLWIYSRTPTMTPAVLAQIEAKGEALGFPAARVVMTQQNLPPVAPPVVQTAAESATTTSAQPLK